jgi:hypothetical protein
MASAPPADVEPLRAKAHGVVGFSCSARHAFISIRVC